MLLQGTRGPMSRRISLVVLVSTFLVVTWSVAQSLPDPDPEVVHPNIRITVPHLSPVNVAGELNGTAANAAVLTVLGASNLKCDPASQLNAVLEANAEAPLRTLAEKVSGASCMTNGRIVHLSAAFTPNGSTHADAIIAPIVHGKPLLIRWNEVLYVLYGVIYDEHLHNSGKRVNVIRQLLLIDPRYANERKFVSFDRGKDDFAQVEGIAEIRIVAP